MQHSLTSLKLAYGAAISVLLLMVIGGSFLLRNEPRLQTPSLIAAAQRAWFTLQFGVSPAALVTTAFEGTVVNNRPQAQGNADSVPVLVYHGILSKDDDSPINLTQERFKAHMLALKDAGYSTVSLSDLSAFLRGDQELPARSIVITFDDGRSDSYYGADPVLAAAGFEAVMYPISKYSTTTRSGGYYLSGPELKRMAGSDRWTIGSHAHDGHADYPLDSTGTTGHFLSNRLWNDAAGRSETMEEFRARTDADFRTAQLVLEDLLDVPVRSFAFPFGDLGQNSNDPLITEALIAEAGQYYNLLMYQYRPGYYFTQTYPDTDITTLQSALVRRIDVHSDWSADELLAHLAHGQAKPLPYTDLFASDHGWIPAWGVMRIQDGSLRLMPSLGQQGASTVLDGTAHWRDIAFTATLESPGDTGFHLWGRFIDERNNAGCNFGDEFVHVEQIIDGEKRVIKGYREPDMLPSGEFTVRMEMVDRTVTCFIDGEAIVRTDFLDPTLTHGGIGIKIWDEVPDHAALTVYQITIEAIDAPTPTAATTSDPTTE